MSQVRRLVTPGLEVRRRAVHSLHQNKPLNKRFLNFLVAISLKVMFRSQGLFPENKCRTNKILYRFFLAFKEVAEGIKVITRVNYPIWFSTLFPLFL